MYQFATLVTKLLDRGGTVKWILRNAGTRDFPRNIVSYFHQNRSDELIQNHDRDDDRVKIRPPTYVSATAESAARVRALDEVKRCTNRERTSIEEQKNERAES